MHTHKPKSLQNIENKLASLEEGSLRHCVLKSAKNFKSSWIELGRLFYSVYKDKMYKEWGFNTFEVYAAKEIGIRKHTAMKLLRSYFFLEKEEPDYLSKGYLERTDTAKFPGYEAVDLLRKAKNKKSLNAEDYHRIRKDIFENGKDTKDLKKDLTFLIRERQELNPQEAYQKRRVAILKRFLGSLKGLKQEVQTLKLLPANLIKETEELIDKVESEIG